MPANEFPVAAFSMAVALALSGCLGPDPGSAAVGALDASGQNDIGALSVVASAQLSEGRPFSSPLSCKDTDSAFEPSIEVDAEGTIYVTAPTYGCPTPEDGAASRLWVSRDGGATFEGVLPLGPASGVRDLPLGMEGDLGLDAAGAVYFIDMTLAGATVTRSTDRGATWELRSPTAFYRPVGDRPWIAGGAADHVAASWDLTVRPGGQVLHVAASEDGGRTWPVQTEISPCAGFPGYAGGYQNGDVAVAPDGAIFVSANCVSGVAAYESRDGGRAFAMSVVREASELPRDFAPVAVDEAGTAYVTWVEPADGTTKVFLSFLAAGSDAWSAPLLASRHGGASLMPWVAARGAGDVVVGYYGATGVGGRPDEVDAAWYPYVTMLGNATSDRPLLWTGQASQEPAHRGPVCHAGGECAAGASDALVDFLQVEAGSAGEAQVVWTALEDGIRQVHWARLDSPPG